MFTGIIEATGTIQKIAPTGGDVRLSIHSDSLDFADVKLGDSIASNGICLTVVAHQHNSYEVDVSRETLNKTALASGVWAMWLILKKPCCQAHALAGILWQVMWMVWV